MALERRSATTMLRSCDSEASGTRQNWILGSQMGRENELETFSEGLPMRRWIREVFWNGFGMSRRRIGDGVLD